MTQSRSSSGRPHATYEEYEQGYADADATLRRLKGPINDLREAGEA